MQTKQPLTSDDGELLTDSLVENSEVFAQPFDKKKKRGASLLRNRAFWRVMLIQPIVIYSLFLFGFTCVWRLPNPDSLAFMFVVLLFASALTSSTASTYFWSRRRPVAIGFTAGLLLTLLTPFAAYSVVYVILMIFKVFGGSGS